MSRDILQEVGERILLCDGAMGTELAKSGLEPGDCGEAWNLDRPEAVLAVHRQYVNAGANCLLTNTFSASRLMLDRAGESARMQDINRAAAQLACQAFGDERGYIVGDIGPLGGMIEPYGELTEQQIRDALREQVEVLIGEGADAILFETQSIFEEIEIGVEEARKAGAKCVIVSMAFDLSRDRSEVRTMMGNMPEEVATFLDGLGVDILGANCGAGASVEWIAKAIAGFQHVCDRPAMAEPNAGSPSLVDMQITYPLSPEAFAEKLPSLLSAGPRIVGGCCGTTPDHIRVLQKAVKERM